VRSIALAPAIRKTRPLVGGEGVARRALRPAAWVGLVVPVLAVTRVRHLFALRLAFCCGLLAGGSAARSWGRWPGRWLSISGNSLKHSRCNNPQIESGITRPSQTLAFDRSRLACLGDHQRHMIILVGSRVHRTSPRRKTPRWFPVCSLERLPHC
jgi:hypothetical protein